MGSRHFWVECNSNEAFVNACDEGEKQQALSEAQYVASQDNEKRRIKVRRNKFRFEKTQFGWKAYQRSGNAYVYFGHFYTQREAREALVRDRQQID